MNVSYGMGKIASLFRRRAAGEFEVLLAPHIDRLYRLAFRLSGNRADAEDLVQELLARLYPRVEEIARLDRPAPWLARALYHLFIDTVRRNGRDPLHEPADASALAQLDDPGSASGESAAEQERLHRRLEAAMTMLNPEQQRLVALHDMEGYTLGELTEMLEVPVGTLKSRLHRARARLREALGMEPLSAAERVKEQRASI